MKIRLTIYLQIDQKTMSSLLALLLLLGVVSGGNFKPEREFEVKQASLLNNGRSFTLVTNHSLFIYIIL